jgi:hypothetical protein
MIDRAFAAVERLPGPAEGWFVAAGAVLSLIGHLILWVSGAVAFGALLPEVVIAPLFSGLLLALCAFMRRVAVNAFEDFRPALGDPAREDAERQRIQSMSDRVGVAFALAVAVLTSGLAFAFLPRTVVAPVVGAVGTTGWIIFSLVVGLVIAQTISQLFAVRHLSEIARNIDVLNPAPVAALSRVTAIGAGGLLVFIAATNVLLPSTAQSYVILDLVIIGFAGAAFLLPLQVMHSRLGRQKTELLSASTERLRKVLASLHTAIDNHDYSAADAINKMIVSEIAERDLLTRLNTWPWTTATIRSFGSALLLPIALFVITRGIDRLL